MGTFNTKTTLISRSDLIPVIAERICQEFSADGYEIKKENLLSGGADISISKGGMFKAAMGLKTALKITLVPISTNSINFEAGVGIFGQQIVPTIITWFFAWPVLITQIWGLIKQSKLDDKALQIAQTVIAEEEGNMSPQSFSQNIKVSGSNSKFCTQCGTPLPPQARFCSNCGMQL